MAQDVGGEQREEDRPIEIELTQGEVAIIDRVDLFLVKSYVYHLRNGRGKLYAVRWTTDEDGKRVRVGLHQDILQRYDVEIDHRNGDGLDNRRRNLRVATHQQNAFNQGPRSNNTSGYKGVFEHGTGWRTFIKANGIVYQGGTYNTREEAARAYDRLSRQHHGEFGYLNFPDEP